MDRVARDFQWGLIMAFKVDRLCVEMSRSARAKLGLADTLSFVEDGDFLDEFYACGLTDEDRQNLETVITVCPTGGEVVPVTKNIRDIIYDAGNQSPVVIRYVYLCPSTVLLIRAYLGSESIPMPIESAAEAEKYVAHQLDYFSRWCTR